MENMKTFLLFTIILVASSVILTPYSIQQIQFSSELNTNTTNTGTLKLYPFDFKSYKPGQRCVCDVIVIVFYTEHCEYCVRLKSYLRAILVKYNETIMIHYDEYNLYDPLNYKLYETLLNNTDIQLSLLIPPIYVISDKEEAFVVDGHLISETTLKNCIESFLTKDKQKSQDINQNKGRTPSTWLSITSSLILLALADSVNPCTFAVYTALLLTSSYYLGKKKTVTTGLSFILAVFIGYYILGLGLLQLFSVIVPHLTKALAFIGLAIGVFSIISGLKPEYKSPIPRSLRSFIDIRISKSYVSPLASFLLGLIASVTLLPCSSGPYLVGLGLLSTFKESAQAYLLLALYNTIFVAPLIVILAAILLSRRLSHKIKAFRSTKLGIMELMSGVLLTLVCSYLLLFK